MTGQFLMNHVNSDKKNCSQFKLYSLTGKVLT